MVLHLPLAAISPRELCCNLDVLYGVVNKGLPRPLGAFGNRRSFTGNGNLQEVIKGLLTWEAPAASITWVMMKHYPPAN